MNNNENEFAKKYIFDFYGKKQKECNESYDLAEDSEIEQVYEEIVNDTIINSLLVKTALVVITANKYERNILHQRVFASSKTKIKHTVIKLLTPCDRYNRANAYFFELNGYNIMHIHTDITGSYTIAGSADIVRWITTNEYLFPIAIISFGICFGTREKKEEIGNVIISKKIYPYFIGAKVNGEDLNVVDDNVFCINTDIGTRINNMINNNKFNKMPFSVKFKNYITGEAVVSSSEWRKKIVDTTTQEIYAGDMEGYGLFKECNNTGYEIPCLILKAICDWGVDKNFDSSNEQILNDFVKTLNFHNIELDNSQAKSILSSLKDRLQAYAANCAYDVFITLINSNIFSESIINKLQSEINNYTGAATTCKKIEEMLDNIITDSNLGYNLSRLYLHRCIILFHEKGILKCEPECIKHNSIQICDRTDGMVSIELKKE